MIRKLTLAAAVFLLELVGCKTAAVVPADSGFKSAQGANLSGIYVNRGHTVTINGGMVNIVFPDGNRVSGPLDRDGTMGASYTIQQREGMVCGTYRISLWISEGVVGDGSTFELSWVRPEGSVAKTCQFMAAAEGKYAKESQGTPSLSGLYVSINGKSTAKIEKGNAAITLANGQTVSGPLDRDGTMGASYTIQQREGMVCGTYRISLWISEGVVGDGSTFELSWVRPEGSVAKTCQFMAAGEGRYKK